MNQSKKIKITAVLLGVVLLTIVGILSFFIVYNAQWLVGDDAIIINRTGWDIPFSIWDTIKPEIGRFYPLAYMHENLVLLLPSEMHDAIQHYTINMFLFIVLIVVILIMIWYVIKPQRVVDLFVCFFSVLLFATRVYSIYLNVFSTLYNYYTLTSVFLLCIVIYYEKKKVIYAIVAILCSIYMVFCLEYVFIVPLTLGIIPLLFAWKQLSQTQVIIHSGLIVVAIIFLLTYFWRIYMQSNTDTFYDPSHGIGVTFLENAASILTGQKFLLFAALVWGVRQIMLILKKDQFHILYDSLLWTAGAILLGGLVLKLDWQMYYYPSIIYSLPAMVHFCYKYFGRVFCLIVVILFAGLHSSKIPSYINENQENRLYSFETISKISDEIKAGRNVIWYETEGNCLAQNELDRRSWIKWCIQSCIQYHLKIREWNYSDDNCMRDCVIFCPIENTKCDDGFVYDEIVPDAILANILIYYNFTPNNEYHIQ